MTDETLAVRTTKGAMLLANALCQVEVSIPVLSANRLIMLGVVKGITNTNESTKVWLVNHSGRYRFLLDRSWCWHNECATT